MNNKNKVLKILDKYRDMSLTMGCEVAQLYIGTDKQVHHRSDFGVIVYKHNSRFSIINTSGTIETVTFAELENETKYTILGHPPTPLTLLKALDKSAEEKNLSHWYGFETDGLNTLRVTRMYGAGVQEHYDSTSINIPLTTTLTEIPEEHEMWQAVLDVLI